MLNLASFENFVSGWGYLYPIVFEFAAQYGGCFEFRRYLEASLLEGHDKIHDEVHLREMPDVFFLVIPILATPVDFYPPMVHARFTEQRGDNVAYV
jgi:hypothetical protein